MVSLDMLLERERESEKRSYNRKEREIDRCVDMEHAHMNN